MPAGCNCGPNSPLAQALAATACAAVLQSLPVSCHFRGCKVPLSRIVSGAISSELAFTFTFTEYLGYCVTTYQITVRVVYIIQQTSDQLSLSFIKLDSIHFGRRLSA